MEGPERKSRLIPPPTRLEWALLALVLTFALALRAYKLDTPLMWCDEAESAINALTILRHGVPVDSYLGQPIFENIFTEPWPQHPEYEFRDTSYSSKGLAVYHGWLPLYAMAAGQWAYGVKPDDDPSVLLVRHSPAEIRARTISARAPAVVFGMIFLVLVWITGREMYGRDAGWAALLAATVAVPIVHVARQARYYSLTLALCMACCLLIWRIATRGRWQDYILGAVCGVLLFHTHILTFAIVCLAGAVMLPVMLRSQTSPLRKLAVASLIGLVGILPWMIYSGFIGTAAHVPKAIATMDLPADLLIYPLYRWPVTVFLLGSGMWLLGVWLLRRVLPNDVAGPFLDAGRPFMYLAAWGLLGWLAFMLLIPAASLWFQRAYLGIVGPGIVLGAIMFAATGRVVGQRWSVPIGCALFLGFIYMNVKATYSWERDLDKSDRSEEMIAHMRAWDLRPGTRIYSTPSDHLIFMYYTGIPVQSVAPVRKQFIDDLNRDVVVIEAYTRLWPMWPELVSASAAAHGVPLSRRDAESWARRLTARAMADEIRDGVARVQVPHEPLPVFAEDVFRKQREHTYQGSQFDHNPVKANPSIFRGYELSDYSWWWPIFFYRFVDVEARSGANLNYAERIRNATATVMPGSTVIYHSPAARSADAAGQ